MENDISENIAQTIVIFTNDTINRIVLSSLHIVQHPLIRQQTTQEYTYNAVNHLIGITTRNSAGEVLGNCEIGNNQNGDPIIISSYDSNNKLSGREIATYDYDVNRVTSSFFNAESQLTLKQTNPIHYQQKDGNAVYNIQGDIVRQPNSDGSYTEYEYKYDQYDNISETKMFTVITRENGKTKRKPIRIYRYSYDYEYPPLDIRKTIPINRSRD